MKTLVVNFLMSEAFKRIVIGIMKIYANETESNVDNDLVSVIEQALL